MADKKRTMPRELIVQVPLEGKVRDPAFTTVAAMNLTEKERLLFLGLADFVVIDARFSSSGESVRYNKVEDKTYVSQESVETRAVRELTYQRCDPDSG